MMRNRQYISIAATYQISFTSNISYTISSIAVLKDTRSSAKGLNVYKRIEGINFYEVHIAPK
jgi:hypothetical protein